MSIPLIIILVIVVVLVVAVIGLYNNLVKLRNMVDNAWAQIDVQLQRRLDLIPNSSRPSKAMLPTKAALSRRLPSSHRRHERAYARRQDAGRRLPHRCAEEPVCRRGGYPDLKANTNFQQLQAELSNTEDKISYMRQSFNDTVMKYNTAIQTFPAVLIAGMMGFKQRDSFDATAGAEVAPKVQF